MSDTNQDTAIASTILQQLGGNRFLMMTGAKALTVIPNGLRLRVNSTNYDRRKVNVVTIVLEPSDTYTVTASYLRAGKLTTVQETTDVYCDQLEYAFERGTGLLTRVGGF